MILVYYYFLKVTEVYFNFTCSVCVVCTCRLTIKIIICGIFGFYFFYNFVCLAYLDN